MKTKIDKVQGVIKYLKQEELQTEASLTFQPKTLSVEEVLTLNLSGVYFLYSGKTLVYIGQSKHVPTRVERHVRNGRINFDRVSILRVNPKDLLKVEEECIAKYKPLYNGTGPRAKELKEHDRLDSLNMFFEEEEL